jgi:hypothetical protein
MISLGLMLVSEWTVASGQSRSVKHYALGPFMISIDPDADLLVKRGTGAIGAEQRPFTAKSAARRKLPTHPKY